MFDLQTNSSIIEDPEDPYCFTFNYLDCVIKFKIRPSQSMEEILSLFPQHILLNRKVSELINYDDDIKDTYVNDLHLDSSNITMNASVDTTFDSDSQEHINSDELDRIFSPQQSSPNKSLHQREYINLNAILIERRKEYIESYIKKPVISIRRVKQLCKWLNSLALWNTTIDIFTIHKCFCNGILLSRLMKYFIPNAEILHLNEKVLTEKTAIENIDKVLGVIKRSKCLNNSRIPNSHDIYHGVNNKIVVLVQELFDVYVRKPMYTKIIKIMKWFTAVLRQYNIPLDSRLFSENEISSIWPHFQSGVALFCIIYHFHGHGTIGSNESLINIDPLRITFDPRSISEFRANLTYVFNLLKALNINVIWEVDDWMTYPDTEFIIMQLSIIYDRLKNSQCSLPPATGKIAGVTSGKTYYYLCKFYTTLKHYVLFN